MPVDGEAYPKRHIEWTGDHGDVDAFDAALSGAASPFFTIRHKATE